MVLYMNNICKLLYLNSGMKIIIAFDIMIYMKRKRKVVMNIFLYDDDTNIVAASLLVVRFRIRLIMVQLELWMLGLLRGVLLEEIFCIMYKVMS